MERKENMPMWVFFGLSSINSRKGAMWLVWSCFVCSILFMPWVSLIPGINFIPESVKLDNWDWAVPTFLITLWYWLCVRWVDKHSSWEA